MQTKPHFAWFLLAPLILAVGAATFVVILVDGMLSLESTRNAVPVPGSAIVTFEEAGPVTVFFEQTATSEVSVPFGLEVIIEPESGGRRLQHEKPIGTTTYSFGGVTGRNVSNVHIPEPGRYRVTTRLPRGVPPPHGAAVNVGAGMSEKLIAVILGSFAVIGVSILLAGAVVIVVAVKRSKHRRQMLTQQQPFPHQAPM